MTTIRWRRRKKTDSPTPWRLVDKTIGGTRVTSIVAADGTDVVFNINITDIDLAQARANAEKIVEAVNKTYPPEKKPKKKRETVPYGIKAYGSWKYFDSKAKFRRYLMDWIAATEGAEQSRAVAALSNLDQGITLTDTDNTTY
jgi:hypothetical protein